MNSSGNSSQHSKPQSKTIAEDIHTSDIAALTLTLLSSLTLAKNIFSLISILVICLLAHRAKRLSAPLIEQIQRKRNTTTSKRKRKRDKQINSLWKNITKEARSIIQKSQQFHGKAQDATLSPDLIEGKPNHTQHSVDKADITKSPASGLERIEDGFMREHASGKEQDRIYNQQELQEYVNNPGKFLTKMNQDDRPITLCKQLCERGEFNLVVRYLQGENMRQDIKNFMFKYPLEKRLETLIDRYLIDYSKVLSIFLRKYWEEDAIGKAGTSDESDLKPKITQLIKWFRDTDTTLLATAIPRLAEIGMPEVHEFILEVKPIFQEKKGDCIWNMMYEQNVKNLNLKVLVEGYIGKEERSA